MITAAQIEQQFKATLVELEHVRAAFFGHLSPSMFDRKLKALEIKLPVIRSDRSQKASKFIHVADLAAYLDARHAVAIHEMK